MMQATAVKFVSVTIYIMFMVSSTGTIAVTENQFSVHGLSAFTNEKSVMLENWLTTGVNATRATLGIYPAPLELHLYPKKSNQPVPWAHTVRDEKGSVHFYVDTRFKLKRFVNDWTIYHELAHMALPYLGSDYRWLSEGFASYMQYQIMAQAGVLKGTLKDRYDAKISPHLRWFNKSELTAAAIANRLMDKRQYPAAYWGSAYFFVLADQQLKQQHNTSLTALISLYQDCCRTHDQSLEELLTSLDGIIEDKLFRQLMNEFKTAPAKKLYPEVISQ